MAATVVSLFKEAAGLNECDRATLAGLLLESLDQPPDPGVEAAWAEEIERRLNELDEGKIERVPWDEVRARLLKNERAGSKP